MLKDDLTAQYHAAKAAGHPHELAVLADLRKQLSDAIYDNADMLDKGLAHQVLVFANQMQDLANRAKRRVDVAQNAGNESFQAALAALKIAKDHIGEDAPDHVKNAINAAIGTDNG